MFSIIHTYDGRGTGSGGCNLEGTLHLYAGEALHLRGHGEPDLEVEGYGVIEVKSGSATIREAYQGEAFEGADYVLYVPHLLPDDYLERQEGFIVKRAVMLEALKSLNLFKENTKRGTLQINTLWNLKTDAPHGRKLEKLIDILYEVCDSTLEEFLPYYKEHNIPRR